MKTEQSIRAITIILALVLLAGCGKVLRKTQSGFLSDYSRLKESAVYENTLVYRSKRLNKELIQSVDSILIQPFEIWIEQDDMLLLDSQSVWVAHEYFHEKLSSELGKHFKIVSKPSESTLSIRGAFSGIKFSEESLKVSDFIPIRIVLNAGNVAYLSATGQKETISEVSIEAEFAYGKHSEIVFAMSATKELESTVTDDESGNVKAVNNILDIWIENFVSKLSSLKVQ